MLRAGPGAIISPRFPPSARGKSRPDDKAQNVVDRLGQIIGLGAAGAGARLERMVAVLKPFDANRLRQLVILYILGLAKRVASALQDQRRCAHLLEVAGARLRGLAGRMKRIAKAYETAYARLVGDHARDAAAKG